MSGRKVVSLPNSLLAFFLVAGSVAFLQSSEIRAESAAESVESSLRSVAGQGQPRIRLSPGFALPEQEEVVRTGAPSRTALVPLEMTAGDFDGDGVSDLVVSYADGPGGVLTLYRGNIDPVFPSSPESLRHRREGTWSAVPFLAPLRIAETSFRAQLLAAGDFDGDGNRDLAVAEPGSNLLLWLKGDGRLGFLPQKVRELSGPVTTLYGGEVHRQDGDEDLFVGLDAPEGPRLEIYVSERGGLNGDPQILRLPGPALAVVSGPMEPEVGLDFAVATRSNPS